MRLYYAVRIQQTHDVFYESGPMGLWTLAEFAITIICGCMPTLPKFFHTIGPKIYSGSKSGLSLGPISKTLKFGRTSAKRSGTGLLRGSSLYTRDIGPQPRNEYEFLQEHELEIRAGKDKEFSSVFTSVDKPLPPPSSETKINQRQLEEEKIEKKRSQIPRTVRIGPGQYLGAGDVESQ